MWEQNDLLRKHAAGNFGEFVKAISRDPAMLDYLNNQQNRKSHPNENFARELMELFTLGIGHYTEDDVKNAARAFTGWGHNGDEFVFRHFDHDDGEKTFLGNTRQLRRRRHHRHHPQAARLPEVHRAEIIQVSSSCDDHEPSRCRRAGRAASGE